jgi:RNA polymerase sigma-54 factor
MKPSLQLKLTQHLALTPQLQQSIRLLQLSTLELEQELEKYLLENPLLEREEEYATPRRPVASDRVERTAPGNSRTTNRANRRRRPTTKAGLATRRGTYAAHRVRSTTTTATIRTCRRQPFRCASTCVAAGPDEHSRTGQHVLVQCLIDALDDDGYLTQSLEDLAETLPAELEIEPEELQIALKHCSISTRPGLARAMRRSAWRCNS